MNYLDDEDESTLFVLGLLESRVVRDELGLTELGLLESVVFLLFEMGVRWGPATSAG